MNKEWMLFDGWLVKGISDRAILVEHDDFEEPVWIPRSKMVLPREPDKGDVISFALPTWLSVEKMIDELSIEEF